jgi:hypothetical protein
MDMMSGELHGETFAKTPEDIFRLIDNQSVNRIEGISLIERYGWKKAKEAVEEFRKIAGIELGGDIEERFNHISGLINDLYENTVGALQEIRPPQKGKSDGMERK